MVLTPMSRESVCGYTVKKNPNIDISHQFYMDDLKLYASNSYQLQTATHNIVKRFGGYVYGVGLDKCAFLDSFMSNV